MVGKALINFCRLIKLPGLQQRACQSKPRQRGNFLVRFLAGFVERLDRHRIIPQARLANAHVHLRVAGGLGSRILLDDLAELPESLLVFCLGGGKHLVGRQRIVLAGRSDIGIKSANRNL